MLMWFSLRDQSHSDDFLLDKNEYCARGLRGEELVLN
jgi:hypothetical protein